MQIWYVLADFELSYFCQNKNSLELLNIIFENGSKWGSFGANKKKLNFLSPDSWKLLTTSLKGLKSPFHLQNESIGRPKYSITIKRSLLRRETQSTWKTSQSWIKSNTQSFVVFDIRECFIEMTFAAWPKDPFVFHPLKPLMHDSALGDT